MQQGSHVLGGSGAQHGPQGGAAQGETFCVVGVHNVLGSQTYGSGGTRCTGVSWLHGEHGSRRRTLLMMQVMMWVSVTNVALLPTFSPIADIACLLPLIILWFLGKSSVQSVLQFLGWWDKKNIK